MPFGPDYTDRCAQMVRDQRTYHRHQCKRRRGFGSNGAYCRQHARLQGHPVVTLKVATQLMESLINLRELSQGPHRLHGDPEDLGRAIHYLSILLEGDPCNSTSD